MRLRTGGESRRDHDAGRLIGPDRLAKRAALTVRCDDCRGQRIAVVAYVGGAPLMGYLVADNACRGKGKGRRRWSYTRPDDRDRGTPVRVWCRSHMHVLACSDLLDALPAPGRTDAELRVSHRRDGDGIR